MIGKVSIPLWFDYNITIRIERRRLENGLNSTMVRLQLT